MPWCLRSRWHVPGAVQQLAGGRLSPADVCGQKHQRLIGWSTQPAAHRTPAVPAPRVRGLAVRTAARPPAQPGCEVDCRLPAPLTGWCWAWGIPAELCHPRAELAFLSTAWMMLKVLLTEPHPFDITVKKSLSLTSFNAPSPLL